MIAMTSIVLTTTKNMKNPIRKFSKNVSYILYLNGNCLVPKIDEIRSIAKQPNPWKMGISESKLDSSILNSEIDIIG